MTVVIGLDLGTTNCKAAAVTPDGKIIAACSNSYPLHSPHPGWAEQEPGEVWSGVQKTLFELSERITHEQVAALCLSGAMHSVLPLDAAGNPLGRAMTWADQRAAEQVQHLRSRTDPHQLYQMTGCPLVSIYHPAKIAWWLDKARSEGRQVQRFVTIKDWVIHQITKVWCTDLSLASSTGLLNIHRMDWEESALEVTGIHKSHLPELVSPKQTVGNVTVEAARATGLRAGLPVIAGASDGGLANLGSGATRENQAVITVGTSGAVRRVVSRPLLDERERTWCYVLYENRWFSGGAINNGGLALQWVREMFYPDITGSLGYDQLMKDASTVEPGAGGVFILPYFTGERSPHWNAHARAMFYGFGLEHSRANAARAVLEGVAYCLADVWEALTAESSPEIPVKLTGAVTRSPLWAQIVCDVLGVPMELSEAADASVVGAAVLGYLGLDPSLSAEDLKTTENQRVRLDPDPERNQVYQINHRRFQELYRSLVGSETAWK